MQSSKKILCHIVPTYNEGENVQELIDRIERVAPELPFDLKVVFVDDNSTDGTSDIIKQNMLRFAIIKLIQRPKPTGLGSAYLDGFSYALTRFNADYVGEMDADLQHPPSVIPSLVKAVESGADVAIASRYVKGGGSRGWGSIRRLVSKGANWQTRTFLGLGVKDCTSGFRAYRKRAAQKLINSKVPTSGFEFQVIALHALKDDMKMVEVPYTFEVRKAGESKLGLKDIVRFFFFVTWAALG
jgi:dolichol-phosphate mannosyltransferase